MPQVPDVPVVLEKIPAESQITEEKVTKKIPETNKLSVELKKAISAEKVYGEVISTAKNVFNSALTEECLHITPVVNISRKIIALIMAENDDFLGLVEHSTPDVYLYAHTTNVSILSVMLGFALDYTEQDLEKLCVCAFLHDIGMIKVFELSSKPGKLDQPDIMEIRKHTKYNSMLLEKLDMPQETRRWIVDVCEQVHERKDGMGYPKGVSGAEINAFAKIIGVADVYEALTHLRSWRERVLPHDALKKMIELAETSFEADIVKLFIEKLSLYPVGSYVRLNTDDIGRVSGVNKGLPTRPKVKVFLDADYNRISPERQLDLSKEAMAYITEPVDETKLTLKDKKLALELKARRWWVKSI
ncbi:MAG: HD domain-containing phosphohydrolase [Elusimicrobiota bacterium]